MIDLKRIDIGRLALILLGAAAMVLTLSHGDRFAQNNADALRILIMVFSILAGILIAIITLIGDPDSLYGGSWRIASIHRRQILKRLRRYRILFYVYLVVITLAFCTALLRSDEPNSLGRISAECQRFALGLGVAALVWSFGLPSAIINAHKERLREAVERRRSRNSDSGSEKDLN